MVLSEQNRTAHRRNDEREDPRAPEDHQGDEDPEARPGCLRASLPAQPHSPSRAYRGRVDARADQRRHPEVKAKPPTRVVARTWSPAPDEPDQMRKEQ